jgi:hypothetical protein
METENKTNTKETSKPILQTLGEGMLKAQQEIDELALQLSLGKTEAKEKFEEIKKEFIERLNWLKQFLKSTLDKSMPVALKLQLEELELQLKVGKAETKESFDLQRAELIEATIALENEIRKTLEKLEVSGYFHHEVEKFLLKLEILRLKFGVKRFEIKDTFRTRMERAKKTIRHFADKAKKVNSRKTHIDFKEEIAEAYKHLKSAVKNL